MNLNELVLAYQEPMIQALQENVRIPSVQGEALPDAPYGACVRDSLLHALKIADQLGFRTVNLDNHIGWAEFGEGEEMIAVLGHLDVVPEGEDWSCEPYGGEIIGGKIMGRGTTDDKGPTIASLFAMAALRDSGIKLRRRVRVILGCNEETGSQDVKHYLACGGEIPVMGFTPDGAYPVIHGEKGIITTVLGADYSQTGDLILTEIRGGTASNVVPEYAWARFQCNDAVFRSITVKDPKVRITREETGFLLEAFGVSAHGSTPEQGENAIGRLLMAMSSLPLCANLAEKVQFLAKHIGMECDGVSAGIGLCDEPSGKLSLNLGTIEGNAASLQFVINYRYPVTFSYEDCGPAFNGLFTENGFRILREFHKEKLYIPIDSQLVTSLMKVYKEQTGRNEQPTCIGGGTYAKSIPNLLAFGPVFPGDEVREHQSDEYITIDNLLKNAQIIAHAMLELAK